MSPVRRKYVNFLIALSLSLMIQILDARPASTAERIVSRYKTRPKKTDCANILKLIDNQRDLFKCLLDAYNVNEQEGVLFPDSEENDNNELELQLPNAPRVPSCARSGDSFCEDIDYYPFAKVQAILKRNNSFNPLFGVDSSPDEVIVHRIGFDEDRFLCQSDQRLIFPKIAKTKGDAWKYIVNQENSPEGYIQGVQIETCARLNGPCELSDSMPSGYVTKCKQKYMYRKLLSFGNEGITMNEYFELPSACCCAYRRDFKSLFRDIAPATSKSKG